MRAGDQRRILTTAMHGGLLQPAAGGARQRERVRLLSWPHHRLVAGCSMRNVLACTASLLTLLSLNGCKVGPADRGPAPSPPTTLGPNPKLPKPDEQAIPIVQVAEA